MTTIPTPITTEITYISTGTPTPYTIPFEYLSKSHVHVTINGQETKDYTYTTAHTITFDPQPKALSSITIKRITPYDKPFITWQDGSLLIADDLNAADMQNIFIMQENLTRLTQIEQNIQNTLATALQVEEALRQYSKGTVIPFGRFYVTDDGCLKLAIYGDYSPDTIYIDDSGHLILRT